MNENRLEFDGPPLISFLAGYSCDFFLVCLSTSFLSYIYPFAMGSFILCRSWYSRVGGLLILKLSV